MECANYVTRKATYSNTRIKAIVYWDRGYLINAFWWRLRCVLLWWSKEVDAWCSIDSIERIGYNLVNERLISIRLQGNLINITVIQAYAPTSTANEATTEQFYNQLQDLLSKTPNKDVTIAIGDFNAKVSKNSAVWGIVGPHGLGEQNEAGLKFVDFCISNELVITNTMFKQHPRGLYTWTAPNGKTKNQIDYILIHKRWRSSISLTKTYPGADCGSDHQLLVAKLKIRLKVTKQQQTVTRFDLSSIPDRFGVGTNNNFHALMDQEEEMSADNIWNEMNTVILESTKR